MANKMDLPFYNGQPVALGGRGWLIVMATVLVAFALLLVWPFGGPVLSFGGPLLFSALPLLALRLMAGRRWTALFRPYGLKQFGQSVGFAMLTLVATAMVGLVLARFVELTPNPSVSMEGDAAGLALLLARAAIQLIGEEAVTILPLLAVLWLCVSRLGWSRRAGLVAAVVVSTVWFSAMHLPTYDWNVLQCLGGIGTARLVLTASYLVTRNMGVSIGAHIANDWTMFFISFAGSHVPVDGAAG